jgi:hypothetical protein
VKEFGIHLESHGSFCGFVSKSVMFKGNSYYPSSTLPPKEKAGYWQHFVSPGEKGCK